MVESTDNVPPAPQRRALTVLGMHRSGTSAVAGCLQRAGVEFGPRLMPPTEANERGYYEHIDVVNLHDRLLMALDRGWDSTTPWPSRWWEDEVRTGRYRLELLTLLQRDFGAASLWGIKDPRLCCLLPWWRSVWTEVAAEPVFLIVVRDPREVAVSLARREGISRDKSYLLWMQHLLAAEKETRGCQRCFLNFAAFMDDWKAALSPLAMFLGSTWHDRLSESNEANTQFLDSSLRRASVPAASLGALPAGMDEMNRLFSAAPTGDSAEFAAELDKLAMELAGAAHPGDQPWSERLSDLQIELSAARKLARWYEVEWEKSARRALKSRAAQKPARQPEKQSGVVHVSNDNSESNLRNSELSFVRKTGSFLGKMLRRYFG